MVLLYPGQLPDRNTDPFGISVIEDSDHFSDAAFKSLKNSHKEVKKANKIKDFIYF